MASKFEEEPGGLLSFSEAALRIGVVKCTWMALTSLTYGGCVFSMMFLLFQIIPPFRLTLDSLSWSPDGEWGLLEHSLLLGSELGLLAFIAFMTLLIPTLIMTWITALVFQYLFGRGFFDHRERLVQEGCLIAKDITWMAFKAMLRKVNVAATIVLIIALLAFSFSGKKNESAEM